jgi:inhibitor of cysteine peptidase
MVFGLNNIVQAEKIDIDIARDGSYELKLPSNPTTGYRWYYEPCDGINLISEGYKGSEHPEGMTGVGGTQKFTFTVDKAFNGITANCKLAYERPWEKIPVQTKELVFHIK